MYLPPYDLVGVTFVNMERRDGSDFSALSGWGYGLEQADVSGNTLTIGNIDAYGLADMGNTPLTDGQLLTID